MNSTLDPPEPPLFVPSVEEIIARASSPQIDPARSTRFQNGDRISLCSTPVYEAVRLQSGEVVPLHKPEGRYGAGYVRVSTSRQRSAGATRDPADDLEADAEAAIATSSGEGWSERDQIMRIVHHFVSRRQAFRIFSDAGLSGGLAYNDPTLIEQLRLAKAERYERVFRAIFLAEAVRDRYTPEQIVGMERFLDGHLREIRTGAIIDDANNPDAIHQKRHRGKRSTTVTYRPGLTLLVQSLSDLHSVALTDLSRLSRSHALFAHLSVHLASHNVQLVGLIERLDWANSRDLGSKISTSVLTTIAEHRLEEVLISVIRGIVTLLDSGRPHGHVPFYLSRDRSGFARFNNKRPVIERLVALFLERGGTWQALQALEAEGCLPPGRHGRGGEFWRRNTIQTLLRNPALVGRQEFFGLTWDVLPRVVPDATWQTIQDRLDAVAGARKNDLPRNKAYLATSLFRCACGRALAHYPHSSGRQQYWCSMPHNQKLRHAEEQPGFRHATLDQENVDAFLDELMRYDPAVMLGRYRESVERSAIKEDIERLRRQAAEIAEGLPEKEARAKEEARTRLEAARLADDEEMVAALVRKLLAPVLGERAAIEEEIRARQRRLDSLLPSDMTTLEARMAAWDGMDVAEKNNLLRVLFREFRMEGQPPHERVVPVLNTLDGGELPPIYLDTKRRGPAFVRRLPPVERWFQSMLSLPGQPAGSNV